MNWLWCAIDGDGKLHGPFAWLAGKGGFVFYAGEKALPDPITLVMVANGDTRPIGTVVAEALRSSIERAEKP